MRWAVLVICAFLLTGCGVTTVITNNCKVVCEQEF